MHTIISEFTFNYIKSHCSISIQEYKVESKMSIIQEIEWVQLTEWCPLLLEKFKLYYLPLDEVDRITYYVLNLKIVSKLYVKFNFIVVTLRRRVQISDWQILRQTRWFLFTTPLIIITGIYHSVLHIINKWRQWISDIRPLF